MCFEINKMPPLPRVQDLTGCIWSAVSTLTVKVADILHSSFTFSQVKRKSKVVLVLNEATHEDASCLTKHHDMKM
jgi:hypothetical protein